MDQRLILDRYRPLATLGEGGHGTVTLAFDTRIARRVAIKSIRLPKDATGLGAGLEEARTAAFLNHPSVLTVYEWDTDDERAHVITEFVDGVDLAALLDAYGALDPDAAAAVLQPVSDALAFGHENGVLHLDVKPENVLVDRDGRVKLADFGISALTGIGGTAPARVGTLGFMPPEQLRNQDVDESTDQWAFAAVAFETLADANPFSADTLEGAIFRAADVEPAAPTEFEPTLPPAIDDVLLAAVDPDPDQRYPSVERFTDALLAHLGDPEVGRARLAEMVVELAGEPQFGEVESLGVWDRLAPYANGFRRLLAATSSGWLVWAGLRPLDFGPAATAGAVALAVLAGGGAPGLGIALGLLALSIGFFADGVLAGVTFLLAATGYWVTLGRHGRFPAFAPILAPALGIGPFGLVVPLLLGFGAAPLTAATAAAWAAGSLHVASAMNGQPAPYLDVSLGLLTTPWAGPGRVSAVADLVTEPGVWISVLAWAVAAAVMSYLCRQGTRAGAALGLVLATLVLGGALGVWGLLDPSVSIETAPVLEHVAGSLILMVVIIAMGAPTRGETG